MNSKNCNLGRKGVNIVLSMKSGGGLFENFHYKYMGIFSIEILMN